jgi:uncharacterized protein
MRSGVVAVAMALAALVAPRASAAQPAPPLLTAPVNDFAGVIDQDSARQLDTLIGRVQDATGDILVVATVRTFQPWPDLPSYALKMFENGGKGIGARGRAGAPAARSGRGGVDDNGLLIVLAVDDRQVRIEVGYGLEAFVTDGFAGETARDTMVPFFRRGAYGQGILAGATRVASRIAQGRGVDLNLAPVRPPRDEVEHDSIPLIVWIILALIMLSAMGGRRRPPRFWGPYWTSGVGGFGSRTGWGGGGWRSGGGGFGGGFGGFAGGRSGGGGGGASW